MRKFDVVVVGGSAAGIPVATTSRRHYPDKSVLLIRKEQQVLIPCGIPYIFGSVGSCQADLIPDTVLQKSGIDLLVDSVVDINRADRVVITAGGEEISYDRLVLAVGSVPIVPPIPGNNLENIFAVKKEVPYIDHMISVLDKASDLVIVGCGFIGVELAEECKRNRNINITIVEMLRHCLELTYDVEFSVKAEEVMRSEGLDILSSEKCLLLRGMKKYRGLNSPAGARYELTL